MALVRQVVFLFCCFWFILLLTLLLLVLMLFLCFPLSFWLFTFVFISLVHNKTNDSQTTFLLCQCHQKHSQDVKETARVLPRQKQFEKSLRLKKILLMPLLMSQSNGADNCRLCIHVGRHDNDDTKRQMFIFFSLQNCSVSAGANCDEGWYLYW